MTTSTVAAGIAQALSQAGLSQRKAAEKTGISQPTLSRILAGKRAPTLPEMMLLAQATGVPLASMTGRGAVADRCRMAARAVDGGSMEVLRRTLVGYLELDAYLADQAIPRAH